MVRLERESLSDTAGKKFQAQDSLLDSRGSIGFSSGGYTEGESPRTAASVFVGRERELACSTPSRADVLANSVTRVAPLKERKSHPAKSPSLAPRITCPC
jgi:hypothetical protein